MYPLFVTRVTMELPTCVCWTRMVCLSLKIVWLHQLDTNLKYCYSSGSIGHETDPDPPNNLGYYVPEYVHGCIPVFQVKLYYLTIPSHFNSVPLMVYIFITYIKVKQKKWGVHYLLILCNVQNETRHTDPWPKQCKVSS